MSSIVLISKLLKSINIVPIRSFTVSQCLEGKRNFRKFPLYGKRGNREFKKRQAENPDPEMPVYNRGVRGTGIDIDGRYVMIPEMIPELIVPDLKNCDLKPYVSYKAPDVIQSEFTSQELFDSIYSEKIVKDFKLGQLDDAGNPLKPSPEESITSEEAFNRARSTGTDVFTQDKEK